jgi:hypothetical protein
MRGALAVVAGVAVWSAWVASPATAGSPRAPVPGARAYSAGVASPESAAIAYLLAPGQLRVRVPGVATREYAVPPECQPRALARDAVFLCGGSAIREQPLLELRLADGALTPVAVGLEPEQWFDPRAAGDAWIAGVLSYISTGGSGKTIEERVIVSRVSGAVVNLSVGFRTAPPGWGPDRYVDLSSTRPLRRLCRPLGREPATDAAPQRRARLTKMSAWTLRPVGFGRWWIQRCGSSRIVRTGTSPILGLGHAAWVRGRPERRVLRLRDLAAGTTRSFALRRSPLGSGQVRIAFTSDRLVVSQPGGSQQGRPSWVVRTIALP